MNCLLPIDWLELLESGDEDSMAEHLSSCPTCRTIVESLRTDATSSGAFDPDWLSKVDLSSAPRWATSEPEEVRGGQIWLTRDSFKFDAVSYSDIDRVFVLVLDDPVKEYDWHWVDVAPLLTDTDSTTATDLLLSEDQTSLGVPLGAYMRYQTTLMTNQLDACVGELTRAGEHVLESLKTGCFDEARFGAQLESAGDLRLAQTEFLQEALGLLGAVYAQFASANEASAEAAAEHAAIERGLRASVEDAYEVVKGRVARIYELKPYRPSADRLTWEARLAAASEEVVNPLAQDFSVREDDIELSGTLELIYHEHGADLTFWFRAVRGLPEHARIVLWVLPTGGGPIVSPAVEPQSDTAVVLASGASVLPIEVDAVKVKLEA